MATLNLLNGAQKNQLNQMSRESDCNGSSGDLKAQSSGTLTDRHRSRCVSLCLWVAFGLGLLVQAFSSHLEIASNAFVLPSTEAHSGVAINPSEVVGRERKLQALSGLLVLFGAIGLAVCYRRTLIENFSGNGKYEPTGSRRS